MTYTRLHDACLLNKDSSLAVDLCHKFPHETSMVDDHGYTPLHIACFGSPSLDVIRALLEAAPHVGFDKDVHGNTALHIAVSQKDVSAEIVSEMIRLCPASISSLNKEGLTPLHMACRHNAQAGVISVLVNAHAGALKIRTKMGDLAPRRKKSSSVSSIGSSSGSFDQNTLFVSNDFNNEPLSHFHFQNFVIDTASKSYLNSVENWSSTLITQVRDGSFPLHMAIASGASREVLELLVMACPEVLAMTDKFGRTPLYIYLTMGSALVDDEAMVTLLLSEVESGGVASMPEKRGGNLPLHGVAMHGGSLQVVNRLIQAYPEAIGVKNKDGKTPHDLAKEYHQCATDVIDLLLTKGQEE